MIGMQYNLQGKGLLEAVSSEQPKWKNKEGSSCASNEPISVLDTRRSPSPSTSTSTLSSSLGGGATTAQPENTTTLPAPTVSNLSMPPAETTVNERKDEWASELQPIPAGLEVSVGGGGERFGVGLEDWDSLLCESGPEQSLFRWITSDVDVDCSFGNLKQLIQSSNLNEIDGNVTDQNSNVVFNNVNMNQQIPILGSSSSSSVNNALIYQQQQQIETLDEKPQIFNPFMNQSQVNLFPLSLCPQQQQQQQQDPFKFLQPNPKRQNLGIVTDPNSQIPKQPFMNPQLVTQMQMLPPPPPPLPLHHHKPLVVPKQEESPAAAARHHNYHQHHQQQQQQQQVVYDQLYKASELILAGNFSHAQGILARLNHQLSSPVVSKPFQRVAMYFKEALMLPLLMPNNPTTPLPSRSPPTPFDGMFKMGAYKFLSEISPIVQFVNFTSNQALLEVLDHDSESIHIIDFDVGFGAQWASFMQELPGRNRSGSTTSLKITAFASPLTHHPLELGLMHENLSQFANEIGVNFELEVVNFDAFDPNAYSVPLFRSSEKEEIVVNFPIWACSNRLPMLPALIRFIKQLSPKIIVSLERGCERSDLPFSHHLLHALQYYEFLLDSIDAANATSEVMNKIERFLLQPRIESIVLGRLHAPDQMPHWKALFASAGFSPVAISNFAEAQAECVLKRSQVRGFHVEKRQASLALCWQRRELVSASAWRC